MRTVCGMCWAGAMGCGEAGHDYGLSFSSWFGVTAQGTHLFVKSLKAHFKLSPAAGAFNAGICQDR